MKDRIEQLRIDKAMEDQRSRELVNLLRMVQVRNCALVGVPLHRLDRELEEIQNEKAL